MYQLKIGSILIQVTNWDDDLFWNFLKWKLDSFCVRDISDSKEYIKIQDCSSDKNEINFEEYPIVYKETRGFFDWIVTRSIEGDLFYALVRRNKQSLYLLYHVPRNEDKILLLEDKTETSGQAAFEYMGRIMPSIFLQHDMLTFHGVLMEYNGKGIVLSADSGVGKTTHARLWRDNRNALIINGDRAICHKIDNQWIGTGIPWSGTSGENINRSVALQAIVILERGRENEAYRITGMEAFSALFPQVQYPAWDLELTEKMLDLFDDLLVNVPIIRLKCLPDVNAVETLECVLEKL